MKLTRPLGCLMGMLVAAPPANAGAQDGCGESVTSRIYSALSERDDIVAYVCPQNVSDCSSEELRSRIKLQRLVLAPVAPSVVQWCAFSAAPVLKGRQFPTLIYEANNSSVRLVAEDWESGLTVLPNLLRRGYYVIEGRSLPGPEQIAVYRLERSGVVFREYQRRCYEARGQDAEVLQEVRCQ